MISTSIFPKVVDEKEYSTPRQAKWWYATFHNVTAMVGAGVLSLSISDAESQFDCCCILCCSCDVSQPLSYSTISWVACFARGPVNNVSYGYKETTPSDSMFRVFSALGQVAFAYAGHGVILEIQATKPSKVPMWRGTVVAYFITALCYFPVAMVGYWTFDKGVEDNVLMALRRPRWLIAAANLMVVVHGSYLVYAMPVFDTLETLLITKLKLPPGITLRLITRSAYVAFTLFIGVTFPFFADLLGFFGGFGFTPTSYFGSFVFKYYLFSQILLQLPCIIWRAIKKPRRFSISWMVNWGSIIFGVLMMLAVTVGSL